MDQGLNPDGVAWPQTIKRLHHDFGPWEVITPLTRSVDGEYAGVPKEKIIHMQDECEASEVISDEADTVFVLHDVYTIQSAIKIREKLEAKEKEAEAK